MVCVLCVHVCALLILRHSCAIKFHCMHALPHFNHEQMLHNSTYIPYHSVICIDPWESLGIPFMAKTNNHWIVCFVLNVPEQALNVWTTHALLPVCQLLGLRTYVCQSPFHIISVLASGTHTSLVSV